MRGKLQKRQALFAFLVGMLLLCAGCAKTLNGGEPLKSSAASVKLPSSTRALGQATVYISAEGGRMAVVHDSSPADVAIVLLPEGGLAVLPAEIAGSEGRYRDSRMTLWEHDGAGLLWIDGELVFSGIVEN